MSTRARSSRWSAPTAPARRTLLSTISGLLRPRRGAIVFDGQPIGDGDDAAHRRARDRPRARRPAPVPGHVACATSCCWAPSGAATAPRSSATWSACSTSSRACSERLAQPGAATLSGGEQQMVAIARGADGATALLMIDELSLGLAPVLVESLMEIDRPAQRRGHDDPDRGAGRAGGARARHARLRAGDRPHRAER